MGLIMAKIIRLAGVSLTDLAAPKIIQRDAIEADGSLFLFDGAHDFGAFSGVPPSGGTVPNVLSNKSAALLSTTESATHFTVPTWADVSGKFKGERTTKGGVHGIITQAGSQVAQHGFQMRAASALLSYFNANSSHAFYYSIWSLVTRIGLTTVANQSPFHCAANTSNYAFHFQGGLPNGPADSKRIGYKSFPSMVDDHSSSLPAPHSRFSSLGVLGNSGTGPGSNQIEFGVGTFGAWDGLNYNKAASRIIYRAYMEDLTVSGRTYAEAEAIDFALYTAAFAPGGKFYGDTYTAPSTMP
jgi:hypothetical protein